MIKKEGEVKMGFTLKTSISHAFAMPCAKIESGSSELVSSPPHQANAIGSALICPYSIT
jgi:hypothetical protein